MELAVKRAVQKSDVDYWFVARLALARTEEVGQKLADRALAAAPLHESGFKEAILSKRFTHGQNQTP